MVDFEVVTVDVDILSTLDQLEHRLHPAMRVLIKTDHSQRWLQINLDKFQIVNGVWKFYGILSHTVYINHKTFHQESEVDGWYSTDNKVGWFTIF